MYISLLQEINQQRDICYRDETILKTVVANFSSECLRNLKLIIIVKPYYEVLEEEANLKLVRKGRCYAIYDIPLLDESTAIIVMQKLKVFGFDKVVSKALLYNQYKKQIATFSLTLI